MQRVQWLTFDVKDSAIKVSSLPVDSRYYRHTAPGGKVLIAQLHLLPFVFGFSGIVF